MGTTQQNTTALDTVEQFSNRQFIDMYKATSFGHIAGMGLIYQAPELTGKDLGTGDRITITLVNILTGTGIGEGGTLVGNEEAIDKETFQMTTGTFRHAVLNPNRGTIEQTRTKLPFDTTSNELLKEYHGSRLDASVFNAAAGNNANTITVDGTAYTGGKRLFVQGLNTPTAPTANRIIRAGGAATDQALTSTDTMTLDLVDDALVSIQGRYPNMKTAPNGRFCMYMSYQQAVDLQRDSGGQIQFYNLELAKMQGGKESTFTQQDRFYAEQKPWGYYKNVDFYSSTRISDGVDSSSNAAITTVKRAVIFGDRGLVYGSPHGTLTEMKTPLRMYSQLQDYDYFKGMEGRMIYGMAKPVQNSEDLGIYVISTHAS